MNKNTVLFSTILTTLFLSACSDGTVQTGGGAGDTEGDAEAVAVITPFVGLYELPGNWNGLPESEAYLDIVEPDANGTSETFLYVVNSMRNCIDPPRASGEAAKEPFSDRVFFDSFNIGDAVLSLEGTELLIGLTEDINDIDADGDVAEPNTLRATRVMNIASASDLGEICQ